MGDLLTPFSHGTSHKSTSTDPVLHQDIVLSGVISPTDSTKQNDYNPTNLATAYEIRWNGTGSIGLTGLAGGVSGREILITNVTTDYLLWLENQNTASTAANRFMIPHSRPAFLMPGDSLLLRYDDTSSRWRVKEWDTIGTSMGLPNFYDTYVVTGSSVFSNELSSATNGTGASAQLGTYLVNTTEKPYGLIQVDTGTTNAGRAAMMGDSNMIIPTLGPALSVTRLAIEAAVTGTETFSVLTGFGEGNAATPTDGVTWEYRWNGSAAEWSQTRWAAGTPTRTTTGSPSVSTNYIWCIIFINAAWTRADFIYSNDSISFTLSSSPTTGIPNNTQFTNTLGIMIAKTAGTTQRNATLDFYGWRNDYVRG
jgi:hypothetical protein